MCVCLSGVILFSFENSKHLKQDVLRELQGCLRGVFWKFQGCFEASRVFEVSRVFQGIFKNVQGSYKGVYRKFQGYFKEVSILF